jgi:hypothetical protein
MLADHPATQVHATPAPRPDDPVITKRRVSVQPHITALD